MKLQKLCYFLEILFGQRSVDHWIAVFNDAGVPHSRINDYAQALADPQVEHMGWVREIELPGGTRTRTFASPLRIDGQGLPVRSLPPALGAHSDEVRQAARATHQTQEA